MNFTSEPPPNPILIVSGILKFVLTPPTLTYADAGRGKPLINIATSVDVPPMSTTIAD